jgi:hypothetical protein
VVRSREIKPRSASTHLAEGATVSVPLRRNPRGHNQEGWSDGRYGAYHELETRRRFVSLVGLTELTHYYHYRLAGLHLKGSLAAKHMELITAPSDVRFSNRPFRVKRFQTYPPLQR